jgi:hypothetical protein
MLGQVKVQHKCKDGSISQCVYVEDLEKHIESKCQGFIIECFCCQQKVRTYKGILKHLKYDCLKLKVNCQFCGNWMSRENFKDKRYHSCHDDFEQVLDKFQGTINKLIEEDNSDAGSAFGGFDDEENRIVKLEKKLDILERKNEILMGHSPNLAQLPLMLTLLTL